MEKAEDTLASLRAEIDALDEHILQLINQRADCAKRVAVNKIKQLESTQSTSSSNVVFYRPEREAQVLRRIMDINQGPLASATVAHLFRDIMSACLALEQPLTIAYLGPEGTFTQQATIKHFGHAVSSSPQTTIDDVFAEVASGQCNYGVVPVENSIEGMVTHTLDNFIDSPLQICGEVELRIRLHFLANSDANAAAIKMVCAHQQALAQARHYLDKHWPKLERRAVSSNGEAARVAASDCSVAAIAGDIAVERYRLLPLAKNIEDYADNTTRFLVVGREKIAASGSDKTSVVISAKNKPGALFAILAPFNRQGVSLTRIDTRPSRTQTWAYLFFIEFVGHQDDEAIRAILLELEQQSIMLKVLGSYPKAVF